MVTKLSSSTSPTKYSWEDAIRILRADPKHQELIFNSYLTSDLLDNCHRFHASREFEETTRLISTLAPGARQLMDMPAGGGIATYSFAKEGFAVVAVEPNASNELGRGAIKFISMHEGLDRVRILGAFGEAIPLDSGLFDVVYVRQGLHHAHDLAQMAREIFRVLRPGGLLIAAREHVVDNYGTSLRKFLDSQVDHQLYGGENAFTQADYVTALNAAGFNIIRQLGPYDSLINLHPYDPESLKKRILESVPGKLLSLLFSSEITYKVGLWRLRRKKIPGRLFTFVATKGRAAA